jgi:hypothetical protein
MKTSEPPTYRLKENLVKRALKTLAWDKFKQHLITVDMDEGCVSELLGHIRRSTDFLLKRPDDAREEARSSFVVELTKFMAILTVTKQ